MNAKTDSGQRTCLTTGLTICRQAEFFVKANAVRTIYFETLLSPAIARTIADETGATTAVLDPLEGLSATSAGDFLAVMRVNLATLREGQGCS